MFEDEVIQLAPNPIMEFSLKGRKLLNANASARRVLNNEPARHALRHIMARYFRRLRADVIICSGNPEKLGDSYYSFHFRMDRDKIRAYAYPENFYESSRFDLLTGLPSRAYFNEALLGAFKKAIGSHEYIALYYIDLNKFKEINDSRGHIFGDKVLARFAEILRKLSRGQDIVARLSGDEFVAILTGFNAASGADSPLRFAERITRVFERPIAIEGEAVDIKTSIGIYIGPNADNSGLDKTEAIMTRAIHIADWLMFYAKGDQTPYHFHDERFN